MIIALGTRSAPKIEALEKALADLGWNTATVESVSVPSGVSDMPRSADELLSGAHNRAKNALTAIAGAEYGVGLEGGVATLAGRTYLLGVAVVCDLSGDWHAGYSPWIEIPEWVREAMDREPNREMGEIMDERTGVTGSKHLNGSFGILTDDRITRADSFKLALLAAFSPWVSPLYRS